MVASQCTTPEMAEPPVIDWLIVLCGGRPSIVIPVCVVEAMIGAALAAPTPSATATATTPKLSDVDLRNAGASHWTVKFAAVTDCRRGPVRGSRDSSGKAAPQIELPQNRHLDLLVLNRLSRSVEHLSNAADLQRKHRP